MDLVARLRGGLRAAMLHVTHAEAEAQRLASRIVTLGAPRDDLTERQSQGLRRRPSVPGAASSGS